MDFLFGLPAHPLLVHAPIVLIPLLLILSVVAIFVQGRWFRWLAIATAALTFVCFVLVFLSAESGETLERLVPRSPLVHEHAESGDLLRFLFLPTLLLSWVSVAVALISTRRRTSATVADATAGAVGAGAAGDTPDVSVVGTTGATPATVRQAPSVIARVVAGLLSLALFVCTIQLLDVGHSGATAVWQESADKAKANPSLLQ